MWVTIFYIQYFGIHNRLKPAIKKQTNVCVIMAATRQTWKYHR